MFSFCHLLLFSFFKWRCIDKSQLKNNGKTNKEHNIGVAITVLMVKNTPLYSVYIETADILTNRYVTHNLCNIQQ